METPLRRYGFIKTEALAELVRKLGEMPKEEPGEMPKEEPGETPKKEERGETVKEEERTLLRGRKLEFNSPVDETPRLKKRVRMDFVVVNGGETVVDLESRMKELSDALEAFDGYTPKYSLWEENSPCGRLSMRRYSVFTPGVAERRSRGRVGRLCEYKLRRLARSTSRKVKEMLPNSPFKDGAGDELEWSDWCGMKRMDVGLVGDAMKLDEECLKRLDALWLGEEKLEMENA